VRSSATDSSYSIYPPIYLFISLLQVYASTDDPI
jgi:hypothetical protein